MEVSVKAFPIGKSVPKKKDGKLGKTQYTFIAGYKGADGFFVKCDPVSCWSDQPLPVKLDKQVTLIAEVTVMNGSLAAFVRSVDGIPVKVDETTGYLPLSADESTPFDN